MPQDILVTSIFNGYLISQSPRVPSSYAYEEVKLDGSQCLTYCMSHYNQSLLVH